MPEPAAATCLFCDPAAHHQDGQVLLRSDRAYLFAGLGPIVDGYIIIAPYRCYGPTAVQSFADATPDLIDEIILLRGLVREFYIERFGQSGMHFEHGRSGVCHSGPGTSHCYHAHLCCYPVSHELWEDMPGLDVVMLDGLSDLAQTVEGRSYLLVQCSRVDPKAAAGSAQREQWPARVVLLDTDDVIESQYLRRKLANRVDPSRPEIWSWKTHPQLDRVHGLIEAFRQWLPRQDRFAIAFPPSGPPVLDFVESVRRSNRTGNDAIAREFRDVWGGREIYKTMGTFLKHLPEPFVYRIDPDDLTELERRGAPTDVRETLALTLGREWRGRRSDVRLLDQPAVREPWIDTVLQLARKEQRPVVLDGGCGPGEYTRALFQLGIECVGIDISPEMLLIAAEGNRGLSKRGTVPQPRFEMMDAMDPTFADRTFDGIWYSAIFVHIPKRQALATLQRLRRLLKDDGILHVSAQKGGDPTVRHEGRAFYFYEEAELQSLFRDAGLVVAERWDDVATRGTRGDTRPKYWMNYILSPVASDEPVLGDLGERRLLERVRTLLRPVDVRDVLVGIGDDCAVLRVPPDERLVVTTDPCPEPVVRILGESDHWTYGWYTLLISLSDLGAMGARPIGVLLAVEAPETQSVSDFDRFYTGVVDACRAFDCPVLGGNLKDGKRFSCVGTMLGLVKPDAILTRGAARPGDVVVVLGSMGRFWSAVLRRMFGVSVGAVEDGRLDDQLRRPMPRVREGIVLASRGLSRCAMDSSDGLIACFYEIARASDGVDLEIDLERLAPDTTVRTMAEHARIDPMKLMLAWGDWQLVCTVRPQVVAELQDAMSELGCPTAVVGTVASGAGTVWGRRDDGVGVLNYVASERFAQSSYFSHGLESYLDVLRRTPLISRIGASDR